MEKLAQPPDYASYSVTDSVALLYTQLDGGLGRQRQDVLDASRFVNVRWSGGRERFTYVRDFYRAYIGRDAEPFLIDLISGDGTLIEYVANFVSFKPISSNDGISFVITAQLEILPADNESHIWPDGNTLLFGLHLDGNYTDASGHGTEAYQPHSYETQVATFPTDTPKFGSAYWHKQSFDFCTVAISDNRGSLRLNEFGEWQIQFWVKPKNGPLSNSGGEVLWLMNTTPGADPTRPTDDAHNFQIKVRMHRPGVDTTKSVLQVTYITDGPGAGGIPSTWELAPLDPINLAPIPIDDVWHFVKVKGDAVSVRAYIDGVLMMHDSTVLLPNGGAAPMYRGVFKDMRFISGAAFSGYGDTPHIGEDWKQSSVWGNFFSGELDDIAVYAGIVGDDTEVPTKTFGSIPNRLILAPDQIGYGVSVGNDQVRTQQEGSAGAYARNLFNNANEVNVSWICDATEYAYLAACHRAAVFDGGASFNIDLLLDDTASLTSYLARFVPGTFSLASVQGETYTVNATLEIKPTDYNVVDGPFVTDAGLSDLRLRAAFGLYVITGQDVNFRLSKTHLHANTGYFFTEGGDSIRYKATLIVAEFGSFAITGQDIALSVPIHYLHAAQGAFILTGEASIRATIRKLIAEQGSYELTGQDVGGTPITTRRLIAARGLFTLTGEAATLSLFRNLTAATGMYSLGGQDVAFNYTPIVVNNKELREGGGAELREGGGYELRE